MSFPPRWNPGAEDSHSRESESRSDRGRGSEIDRREVRDRSRTDTSRHADKDRFAEKSRSDSGRSRQQERHAENESSSRKGSRERERDKERERNSDRRRDIERNDREKGSKRENHERTREKNHTSIFSIPITKEDKDKIDDKLRKERERSEKDKTQRDERDRRGERGSSRERGSDRGREREHERDRPREGGGRSDRRESRVDAPSDGKQTESKRDDAPTSQWQGGDWRCDCGENNFARRTKCFRCHKYKPGMARMLDPSLGNICLGPEGVLGVTMTNIGPEMPPHLRNRQAEE